MINKYKFPIIFIIIIFTTPITYDYVKEIYFENITYDNISIKKPTELEVDSFENKYIYYNDGFWHSTIFSTKTENIKDEKIYYFKKKIDDSELIIVLKEDKDYIDFRWIPDLSVDNNTDFFNLNSNYDMYIKGSNAYFLDLRYKNLHIYSNILDNKRKFHIQIDGKIIYISLGNNFNDNSILIELFDEINEIVELENSTPIKK